jgi:hypothetical protein
MKRKYFTDSLFFNKINFWEEKHVYFLGWLMSDGHHNVKKKSIQIRLQEEDRKILEILKDIIEYTGPVTFLKRNGINDFIKQYTKSYQHRYSLVIRDNQISNDLLNLKIDNNKTNNLEFPNYLKNNLISHYLRAFYEGDGTISYSKHKTNPLLFDINLISTPQFCWHVKEFLKQKLNIDSRIVTDKKFKNGNIEVKFSGRLNALKFFNYVYKDANFVLKRKFRKFLKLINFMKKQKTWSFGRPIPDNIKEEISKSIYIAKNIVKYAKY